MVLSKLNGVWRVFDVKGGGWVSWVKASSRSKAKRQLEKGLVK